MLCLICLFHISFKFLLLTSVPSINRFTISPRRGDKSGSKDIIVFSLATIMPEQNLQQMAFAATFN